MNPKQFLYEMYEQYCDLDAQQREAVKRDIAVYASPEFQLAMQIAELNGVSQETLLDLQSARKVVADLQSLRKGA